MNKLAGWVALGAALVANPSQAFMATTWNAASSGAYREDGYHLGYSQNYGVSDTFRNFFVFVLYPFSGEAVSVTLTLNTGINCTAGTYTLYGGVTTPPYTLNAGHAVGDEAGQAIYQDLGDGDVLGSWIIPSTDNVEITLELNSLGVATINEAAGGVLVLGGVMSGGRAFALSDENDIRQLTVYTIPESGTCSLLLLGASGLACILRRPRR